MRNKKEEKSMKKKRAGKATENFPARFFASDFDSFLFRIDAK